MRMWMIDPDLMCDQHLLGEHGEIHKHCHNFIKKHSVKKRLRNRQIFPSLMKKRHDELTQEMIRRGMKHNSPYEMPDISHLGEEGLIIPNEQDIKNNIIDLAGRCEECRKRIINYLFTYNKSINLEFCCVCGEIARYKHMSFIGQIPFYVCSNHYHETSSAIEYDEKTGESRMGLININNNEWMELISNPLLRKNLKDY